MSTTISETCSCGAKFDYTGDSPSRMSKEWRETHRHELPASKAEASPAPEVHAVTGTHHQAGTPRTGPVGRRAVGFQLTTTEKENH